jgi:prepilin-type N-terminal cleavage/methylation domain-containing protein
MMKNYRSARPQQLGFCLLHFQRQRTFGNHERRGLTLIELMISIMIMSVTVVALGMMFRAVEISSEYNQGYGTATQHARVTMDRLDRAINQAYSNSSYCGTWVTQNTVGSYTFPDTLVVWRPSSGTPTNPSGAPLASELEIFCPDPASPGTLVEITVPSDTSTMPSPSSTTTFKSYIDGLKIESGVNKVQLTNLLHTAAVTGSTQTFGAVRFVVQLSPTDASYSSYKSGSTTFENLTWAQSVCSPSTGLRQVWVRTELQLNPAGQWLVTNAAAEQSVPFFGSSAYYYEMTP